MENLEVLVDSMKEVLMEKNKRYGNSALEPNNIFSKLSATNSICVRLDDKIGRIKNSSELRTNDICDIIGYCFLLLKSLNVSKEDILKQID